MVTLFMPMAPNPVMGGHVVHVPVERVCDVDMTVEEGVRSIVTSGVAIGESGTQLSLGGEGTLADTAHPPQAGYHAGGDHREPTPRTGSPDRESAYTDDIDPENASTPDGVARTERAEPVGDEATHHQDLDRPEGTIGDNTDHPAAFDQPDRILGSDTGTPSDIDSDEEGQD